jgi:hypothetical protein
VAKRILSEWNNYVARVMPRNAPPVQTQETRRAFYAGASSLLAIILIGLDAGPDDEPTPGDMNMMNEIQQELREFSQDVEHGRA